MTRRSLRTIIPSFFTGLFVGVICAKICGVWNETSLTANLSANTQNIETERDVPAGLPVDFYINNDFDDLKSRQFTDKLIKQLITNDEDTALAKLVANDRAHEASGEISAQLIRHLMAKDDRNSIMAVLAYFERHNWDDAERILEYLRTLPPSHKMVIYDFVRHNHPHLFGILAT